MNNEKVKIFLVDDDAVFLKSLKIDLLRHADFSIETFAAGEHCIENLSDNPDVVILDYLLDGMDKNAMNGIEVLDRIKLLNPDIPVVMLSQQDKIDVAIKSIHHKAFDYVVKSETAIGQLQKIITAIYFNQKMEKETKPTGMSTEYENIAKTIQEFAIKQQHPDGSPSDIKGMSEMVQQLENVGA
jgi:DNA-binding NtrC family response regulator